MTTSTPDWVQAWGTVAGAAFAAAAAIAAFLVLVHEIRIRRRDENDLRAATARLVLVTAGEEKGVRPKENVPGMIVSIDVIINNFSRFPVVDVSVVVERLSGERERGTAMDLLKPGESYTFKCVFQPSISWPYRMHPPNLFRTKMIFTDDNGLRWQRIDRQQPSRIFSSDQLPDWYNWHNQPGDAHKRQAGPEIISKA